MHIFWEIKIRILLQSGPTKPHIKLKPTIIMTTKIPYPTHQTINMTYKDRPLYNIREIKLISQ